MQVFDTPEKISQLRARMNMVAIRTYLSTGLRVTRVATNRRMLEIASETTGTDYLSGGKATREKLYWALLDLEELFHGNQ